VLLGALATTHCPLLGHSGVLGGQPPQYREEANNRKDNSRSEDTENKRGDEAWRLRNRFGLLEVFSPFEPIKSNRGIRSYEIRNIDLHSTRFASSFDGSVRRFEKFHAEPQKSCLIGNHHPFVRPAAVLMECHAGLIPRHFLVQGRNGVLNLAVVHCTSLTTSRSR